MSDVHDPFDRLAEIARIDEAVDPEFAARLRDRLRSSLGAGADDAPVRFDLDGVPRAASSAPGRRVPRSDDIGSTTASSTSTSTSTSTSERKSTMSQVITPYICVHDAQAAIEWYREYFGATVDNVIPWDGRIGHAEVDVAGAVFYLSDEAVDLGVVAPERDGSRSSVSIVIQVAAVDQFVERATSGGAVVQRPIEEAHGSRSAWIVDPFGHRWNVGTPVYDEAAMASRRSPSEPYYFTLTSADVERATAFYGAVLGWEFAEQRNGGRHIVNTEMPMGLRPTDNQFSASDPGEIQMWFIARDFDDAVERVRVAGGTVVELNAHDSGREAVCEDDQGVTFRLNEPAPGYDH